MADPMTQSSQISSSQGLNDGHSAASKDSKFSDSFFSSSPVSLIQSPQDKRVVLGSDKPSEGVATSLRFSSQPSSFSPVGYGNESSGPPVDRSFQEKRERFESSVGSQKQDSSPIKVSPVSERIKALEALAAKQNDSDWNDGGFPHFRERHYEKPPTEIHGISSRSSFKKRATSTEQESPESPFEVLGDARHGSDFEDTADWMKAHLPPAPDFGTEESDFDEVKESAVVQESPSTETKGKDTDAPEVPASFVGVPDEFMDTPIEVAEQVVDDNKQSKQDSVEEESEFDLRFLPTAYMWDKQEKSDMDTQGPSSIPETQDSEIPVSSAPPDGFESSSVPSPPPAAQMDSGTKQQSQGGGSEPAEILEVDSSGESDDTVIEDASGGRPHAGPDAPESVPCIDKVTLPDDKEKQGILVPIINVIETEEQNISDDEMVQEEEEDDERYQVIQEPTTQAPISSDEHSEVSKSEEVSLNKEDIFSPTEVTESDADYSPKHKIKDDVSEDIFNQTCVDSKGSTLEESCEQSPVLQNVDEPQKESYVNIVKPDKTAEITPDLPHNYEDLSNEIESSDIDTYLDHYTSQELALKDQLNSGVLCENDGESNDLQKSNSLERSQNDTMFAQQSVEETIADEIDEQLNMSKQNIDSVPEPLPVGITDVYNEPLLPQNEVPSHELEDQCVDLEDRKTVTAPGSFSLVEEKDYISQTTARPPYVQENTPAPFPSFHHDPSDKISEVISDFVASDLNEGLVTSTSEHDDLVQHDVPDIQMSPESTSEPESIEPECSVITASDSFVEFMRECLKSQQDEQPESLGLGHVAKDPTSVAPSPPAMVMDLEQERLTICALKELGSSQEQEDEISVSNKTTSVSSKEGSQPSSKSESSVPSVSTPQHLLNEYEPETSLAKEVEAIDMWVAEAYHLAEHVLAAILTHLSVYELVHWRDPKKTGVVFGTSLLLLLSLAAFSVISVISYLLLALLCVTITFRIYKSVIQAVQKSSEGHPFKALMEKDVSVPPETFRKHVDVCLTYINRALKQMSRLFLVEDLVDSLKLAVVMWLLTYVGAVFNGITILILADILIFSVPLLYEKNKTQIDHYIEIARTQFNTTIAKLQEKLPGAVKRSKAE
ncbi:reticulon-3 isoform X3 [Colossoma macropomum]|uniref:reticulon-3 isoform X3 n=1 Tax=Colossoma macropomum TaxID=42526 RepID=UPI0018652420|nr:reticulon-3 isoform X3 [Colossoma macropomum]